MLAWSVGYLTATNWPTDLFRLDWVYDAWWDDGGGMKQVDYARVE